MLIELTCKSIQVWADIRSELTLVQDDLILLGTI